MKYLKNADQSFSLLGKHGYAHIFESPLISPLRGFELVSVYPSTKMSSLRDFLPQRGKIFVER